MATGREAETDPAAEIHRALDDLERLPVNWNGYGTSPIDPDTIAAARGLVPTLISQPAGMPSIVPMTRGRLQFEWHRGVRSLELELASAAVIRYLKWDPTQGISEEAELPIGRGDEVRQLVAWFAAE
jgi:hypothetical protein